jgi:superfamily II DNA or RNA helicase
LSDERKKQGGELFIVDNSDADWKVKRYLQEWADIAHSFDIATGFFEIGALLEMDGQWQKLQKLRILMGNVVSMRTKKTLVAGIEAAKSALDKSIEIEKEENDFLTGVPAIVDAVRKGQIECRIYTKDKFHAKAYITHAKQEVVGSTALVGSSNLTVPGLTTNVELNIQLRREVEQLQEWYERHWREAENISEEILKVIARHTKEYSPFEVYAKSLQEFFRGHELTAGEWEKNKSHVYPVLDQYQKEGYQALIKIANQYGGAFLCDGVGLGKTLIGLMVIERLIYERKRVLLLVPKAAREPVWDKHLRRYLPYLKGDYSNLAVYNHTDLLRGSEYPEKFERLKEMADVIVIDEGHHFRTPGVKGKTRYWQLSDICKGKMVISLTATPINNSLRDLQHMIELFSQRQTDYFKGAPLGIHSLAGHFRRLENDLEEITREKQIERDDTITETDQVEAQQVLFNDSLFRALVVQRSRMYVRKSQEQYGGKKIPFPTREPPRVADYSLKKVYGNLLALVEAAFAKEKPLFSLAMYYPLAYPKKPLDSSKEEVAFRINRQKQLVRLIRILFLKRFESSTCAFEISCQDLLLRMLTFVAKHSKTDADKRRLERWKAQNAELIGYVQAKHLELFEQEPDEENEDIITPEMLEDIEELSEAEYDIAQIINETYLDMDEIVRFLEELRKFKSINDDKLKALIKLLKTDPVLAKHKVIIFTEFMMTAHYMRQELTKAGITGLDEVDSATKVDRGEIISRFSPYYNDLSSSDLKAQGNEETRVLVSTDVLSEGLNLQDATRLINYDLHWNPVRLMQRIGRVDRRLNQEIEDKIIADHPDQKDIRGKVVYWNFLPPDELDNLLHLYSKVSGKTLKISKVFGIEGKKLLKPEDDYDALKDFNHEYEGTTNTVEEMHLDFQKLLQDHPGLEERLNMLPGRLFSGKQHPTPGTTAVFFCYSLPAPGLEPVEDEEQEAAKWSEETGYTQWYLYDLATEKIIEETGEIVALIRSTPETPRYRSLNNETLVDIRKKIEKHIKNTYLKRVQAPVGIKAKLKAWMELS